MPRETSDARPPIMLVEEAQPFEQLSTVACRQKLELGDTLGAMPALFSEDSPEVKANRLFVDHLPVEQQLTSLSSVFHAAPVGLCVIDVNFRYVTVNPCFARMYHHEMGHFLGRTVEQALPGPAPQIMLQLREVLATGLTLHREIVLRDPATPEDEPKPRQVTYFRSAQPIRDQLGAIVGISVSVVDVTRQKLAESALRESEENFRYTVELTPHIPWTADAEGNLDFLSPRWEAITGVKLTSYSTPGNWLLALHPQDRIAAVAKWEASVETGEPSDIEYRVRVAGGGYRWMRARAYPRRGPKAEIIRWYGMIEDIHDRKLVEAALQIKTDELARRVREDHLTGLANRRRFDESLEAESRRARRAKLPLALLMIDVDHFKQFNDRWGHIAGDECLKMVATALYRVSRRPGDLVARFGGEEFAMILPNTGRNGAERMATLALEAVAILDMPDSQRITVSIGIGTLDMEPVYEEFDPTLALLQAADAALYGAKAEGRNRIAFFS